MEVRHGGDELRGAIAFRIAQEYGGPQLVMLGETRRRRRRDQATVGLLEQFGPDRIRDTPISSKPSWVRRWAR